MYSHPQQGGDADEVKRLRKAAGAWLRDLRLAAGLSQRDLANRVGVEYYTFVSQIEAGRGRIPPERYESFASALGVEPRDFVKELLSFYDPITYRLLFR